MLWLPLLKEEDEGLKSLGRVDGEVLLSPELMLATMLVTREEDGRVAVVVSSPSPPVLFLKPGNRVWMEYLLF